MNNGIIYLTLILTELIEMDGGSGLYYLLYLY